MIRHEFLIDGGPERFVLEGHKDYIDCFISYGEGTMKRPLIINTREQLDWVTSHLQGLDLRDLLEEPK